MVALVPAPVNQATNRIRNNYCQGDVKQILTDNVAQFPDSETWIGALCSPDSSAEGEGDDGDIFD